MFEGEAAIFSCSGDGSPAPIVRWWMFQNDVPIPVETDGRIIVSPQYLTITAAAKVDSGKYFCALNSSAGITQSTEVFLNVWSELILPLIDTLQLAASETCNNNYKCVACLLFKCV